MIELHHVRKSFNGQEVLKGINLSISNGELLAIIGKSGEGKTVLLKHLIGLLTPDSGRVVIDGADITRLGFKGRNKMREKLGVLFQGGALFDSLTVYGNVAFPLKEKTKLTDKEIEERVKHALEDVGLRNIEQKYPAELSGGMKKRVALARALITEPSVVLFDEPTTGLDPIILNSIHALIRKTHKKYRFTGIMISHEIPEIFDISDRIAMLHDGIIVQAGTPEEIKSSTNPVVQQFITGNLEGPIRIIS